MTAPSTWPDSMLLPTVSVFADGAWVADGRDDTDAPQALDGLTVTWGRSNVVDQPQASTCSLTLIDRAGGSRFLDMIRVGGRLDVLADAIIGAPPDPGTGTGVVVISEGFETGLGNTYTAPAGAASLATVAGGSEGSRALQVDTWTGQAPLITVPPAPREPTDGNPAAWDAVPRSASGETWAAAVDVKLPATFAGWGNWAAELIPVSYTAPWDVGAPLAPLTTTAPQAGGWLRISGTFVPPPGVWLGLSVRFWPIGPAWDELDTTTWDAVPNPGPTWDGLGRLLIDRVKLSAPAAGTLRRGMVFSGRVTDLEARYDDADQATLVDVTAADQRAELGNRDVGDTPWPLEPLGTRFGRIVTASGQPIESRVSTTAAAYQVSWRDVDRQPAMTLLSELATTADGVLWAATHPVTGPYLLLESLADRPALSELALVGGVVVIVLRPVGTTNAVVIDACDVLLEPVRWRHDVEDMGTRVQVTWREQTLDDKGQPAPTDRVESVINTQLENDIGVHRIAVGTQLAGQTDARIIADAIMGRTSNTAWRISGLEWRADTTDQLDGEALTRMMQLLDGTTRNGLPIILDNLPAWSPIPDNQVGLYLEGGRYESIDGSWRLTLLVSAATAIGMSAAWDQLDPAWTWDQFDPDIRWIDLAGVAP